MDTVQTPYGALGKWMLACRPQNEHGCADSDRYISDWLGQKQANGEGLYEPVDVVIVDRTSASPEASTLKLLGGMAAAGFPSQYGHSDGYGGVVGSAPVHQQQPARPTCGATDDSKYGCAFADEVYNHLGRIDHGRAFGPAPLPDGHGYVWTAALSTEQPGFYHWRPTHVYKSFDRAESKLCKGLAAVTGVTIGDPLDLHNRIKADSGAHYTGDYSGKACLAFLP
ncbi:hypothetical protein ABTZ03_29825 [Kitasatospora sp. NPDC096077]|uniref:hypothetical protein n=1 Tax=Kitasatospora sp. NPDC096077 TaxID=3155544 RepID=UPI00331DE91F